MQEAENADPASVPGGAVRYMSVSIASPDILMDLQKMSAIVSPTLSLIACKHRV